MEMPAEPEVFLEPSGISWQRPCARIHQKRFLPLPSGRWDERQILSPSVRLWHNSRPCCLVHGSGQGWPGSGGSRSRRSDMDPSKPAFMSGAPRLASSSRPFDGTNDKYRLSPSSLSGLKKVSICPFGRALLYAVLTLLFYIYVLFFNRLVQPTFSSSVSSFLSLTGRNTGSWYLSLLPPSL